MAERIYPEEKPLFTSPPSAPAPAPPPPKQYEQFLYNPPNNDVIYRPPPAYPYPPPRRRRSSCCSCLACLISVIIAAFILVAIAILIFYVVVQPRAPKYTVQDVQIAEFNLRNQTSGGPYLSSDVTFTVNARNPNKKMGIYYDEVDVTLSYEGEEIGSGSIPSFYQGHKNTTVLVVRMEGENRSLDKEAGSSLRSAVDDGNSIFLRARIEGHIRVKVGGWKSRHVKLVVKCDVEISSPSSLGSERVLSKKCKLHL